MSRVPAGTEDEFQPRAVALLERYGWYVLEMDKAGLGRTRKKGAFRVGFPDLLGLKKDRFVLLELKTETGEVREKQVLMHALLARFGIRVHVCRSEEDVLAALFPKEKS